MLRIGAFAAKFLTALLADIHANLRLSVFGWTPAKLRRFPTFATAKMVRASFFAFVNFAACFTSECIKIIVVMGGHVLNMRSAQGQVFDTIIGNNTVDVMNYFTLSEWTA